MANLAANPSGSSSVFGQPGPSDDQDVLSIVNQLKDREMRDFQNKSEYMADLSLRQEARMRKLFPPEVQGQQQTQNIVAGADPNAMTGYQKGELGIRQQELGQEKQKLTQQGKLGQEAIDVRTSQEKLNQQKSDQINTTKQADMQRKIEESNQKIELAQQALTNKTANAEAQLQSHKDLAAAVEERHKLELAQKDAQFKISSGQHEQTIKDLEEKIKQTGRSKVTTEINPDGTKRTTTTEKGSAADTITVTGRDGKSYEIPADKLDDWNANHKQDEQ